jgi:hypothetical protein
MIVLAIGHERGMLDSSGTNSLEQGVLSSSATPSAF